MVTRVRIEANGATASEVEAHMHAMAAAVAEAVGEGVPHLGEQVIERDLPEPDGHTAHKGRLIVYLNVAHDAPQVRWLKEQTGACTTVLADRHGNPLDNPNHWEPGQRAAAERIAGVCGL